MKNISLIIILSFLFMFGFFAIETIFLHTNPKEVENIFIIEKGTSFLEIGEKLDEEGLIKNKYPFYFYVIFTNQHNKIKAGEYFLSSKESLFRIVNKIVKGDIAKEIITIPEGWNLRDIAWYFESKGMFQAEELFEIAGFPALDLVKSGLPSHEKFDYEFLQEKPIEISLEGYLFPDTYEIARGENLKNIVDKMIANFDKKLTLTLRQEIENQGKNIFDVITTASLLEKEVKTKEDKKIVAGILENRLRINMPLQIDATISYITGNKTVRISTEETKIDSPFNTYKYKGLPIGPICNPGLESIEAVLNSQDSDYLYYLSTLEGETIFSKTLTEHNIAKAKYLK
ncbi:MAG: endolytic transglycosylase MltG [Patescibacteria group bacterium]